MTSNDPWVKVHKTMQVIKTPNDIPDRFAIRAGYELGNPLMEARIVDLQAPELDVDGNHVTHVVSGEPMFKVICECYTMNEAELISMYLNSYHKISVSVVNSVQARLQSVGSEVLSERRDGIGTNPPDMIEGVGTLPTGFKALEGGIKRGEMFVLSAGHASTRTDSKK